MKGPVGEEEDLEDMGSPQGSLQAPGGSATPQDSPLRALQGQAPEHAAQQQRDESSSSPEALLAEDERSAENAVGLQDEAQACLPLS